MGVVGKVLRGFGIVVVRCGGFRGLGGVVGNGKVIRRFYEELWNRWDLAVADEILSEDVRFRSSLGATLEGREAFKEYVRAAFPDWHNRVDEMIDCGDRVVTRMT